MDTLTTKIVLPPFNLSTSKRVRPAFNAQAYGHLTGDQVAGFDPHHVQQYSFVEIGHEIFSTVILSLQLIQEGQLSISGKRNSTNTG